MPLRLASCWPWHWRPERAGAGDETAISLGFRVGQTRLLGIIAAALLAAVATAIAGPISFIGLAVPHIIRAIFGEDFRWRIPAAVIAGALALVAADILARVIIRPQELMVGIVTAFIGASFLLAVRRGGDEMTVKMFHVGEHIAMSYRRRRC